MTTTADTTETATIGQHLHVAPDPSAEATLARLLDLAGRMHYVVVPHREWHELLAAGQEAAGFLQAANAEVRRLRQRIVRSRR